MNWLRNNKNLTGTKEGCAEGIAAHVQLSLEDMTIAPKRLHGALLIAVFYFYRCLMDARFELSRD